MCRKWGSQRKRQGRGTLMRGIPIRRWLTVVGPTTLAMIGGAVSGATQGGIAAGAGGLFGGLLGLLSSSWLDNVSQLKEARRLRDEVLQEIPGPASAPRRPSELLSPENSALPFVG